MLHDMVMVICVAMISEPCSDAGEVRRMLGVECESLTVGLHKFAGVKDYVLRLY